MALIGRLFVVLLAYWAASLAAGAILVAVGLPGWSKMGGLDRNLIGLIVYGFFNISAALLLPALVVLAITEALYIQRALAYAILGALGLILVACYVGLILFEPATHFRDGVVAALMTGAGIVAGIVYWSIAGRNAGRWRKPPLPPQMPSPDA